MTGNVSTLGGLVLLCAAGTSARAQECLWSRVGTLPPRVFSVMAFDSDRARTVLFGGHYAGAIDDNKTYEWDGSGWALVSSVGPAPRGGHALAYDSARHRTVLYGGGHYCNGTFCPYFDTWEWDGTEWLLSSTTGPAIANPTMAFDSGRARTLLTSGEQTGGADGSSRG